MKKIFFTVIEYFKFANKITEISNKIFLFNELLKLFTAKKIEKFLN